MQFSRDILISNNGEVVINNKEIEKSHKGNKLDGLSEKYVIVSPFEKFKLWFKEAMAQESYDPNLMTLATSTNAGMPSANTVLFTGIQNSGFLFSANHEIYNGINIEENPNGSLLFYWRFLTRQVIIDGKLEERKQALEEYVRSQPFENNVDLQVSPKYQKAYCLRPHRIEFWQGRPMRLHDRLQYLKDGDQWRIERLAP